MKKCEIIVNILLKAPNKHFNLFVISIVFCWISWVFKNLGDPVYIEMLPKFLLKFLKINHAFHSSHRILRLKFQFFNVIYFSIILEEDLAPIVETMGVPST